MLNIQIECSDSIVPTLTFWILTKEVNATGIVSSEVQDMVPEQNSLAIFVKGERAIYPPVLGAKSHCVPAELQLVKLPPFPRGTLKSTAYN
jgi:hypothetical protein